MDRAIQVLADSVQTLDETLLPHFSPLGWEHINPTGDYIWQQDKRVKRGRFRPLRAPREASRTMFSVSRVAPLAAAPRSCRYIRLQHVLAQALSMLGSSK